MPFIATKAVATTLPARISRDFFTLIRHAMSPTSTPSSDVIYTVADLLRRRAAQRPNQPAFVFIPDSGAATGEGEVAWTYAELDRRAAAVANAVSQRTAPGDRAVLVFTPGLDFLAGFFGCLYAGVLPVPATYPKPRRPSPRLDAIVADCQPQVALTTTSTLGVLELDDQSPAVRSLEWIAVDRAAEESSPLAPVERRPDDPAFLQYTSGSTSQPRGVVVTHANLLHNLELIRTGFNMPPADANAAPLTGVFWLPAYHDMGLIGGILSPMYVGGAAYLMAPATFLQRPLSWLEAMSRTGASISGAPNFAYELCVRKTTPKQRAALNLSKWHLAFCGAEPIDGPTLKQFAEAFTYAGFSESAFYPCYGLAESTLMVTGGKANGRLNILHANRSSLRDNRLVETAPGAAEGVAGDDRSQPLVSCGRPLGDQQVHIVNPQTFELCPAGAIGEIWVRGRSVAAGYWNHPEEVWQTFGGRLADGSGPYLRTGDLGAFYNGELYVTGRAKDLIIIRGRNLYPQDIERTAQLAHEAVETGVAFSIQKDGREELVVVHQVAREHRRGDLSPVIRAIRSAVVEEHDIDPHAIVLLRPGALPITSSGKVQRHECRAKFERGELDELARWTQPVDLQNGQTLNGHRVMGSAASGDGGRPEFLNNLGAYDVESLTPLVQAWMLAWLDDHVDAADGELTATAPFTALGMDSLTALELNVEFEQVLGVSLPPAAAWSYPTPAALSRYLAETLLGLTPTEGATPSVTDSWFLAMEADANS